MVSFSTDWCPGVWNCLVECIKTTIIESYPLLMHLFARLHVKQDQLSTFLFIKSLVDGNLQLCKI